MPLPRSCTPCCACECVEGTLPYTMTVSFSGMDKCSQSYYGLSVIDFLSCFGDDAAAGARASQEDGPLTTTYLHERGDGYAVIGRSEPSLTATARDAVLSLTLGHDTDGPFDYWGVASMKIESAGSGFVDGTSVTIEPAPGVAVQAPADVRIRSTRTEPTLSASVSGGSGAQLSVTLVPVAFGVQSVSGTLTNKVGYGWPIDFSRGSGVEAAKEAAGFHLTTLEEPEVTFSSAQVPTTLEQRSYPNGRPYWTVVGYDQAALQEAKITEHVVSRDDGFRAIASSLEPQGYYYAPTAMHICNGGRIWHDNKISSTRVLTAAGEYYLSSDETATPSVNVDGCTVTMMPVAWGVASVSVADPGSGYTNGSPVTFSASPGDTDEVACVAKIATNASGNITGVTVTSRGKYYKRGGIDSVVIVDGGKYYKDDPDAAPYVASVFPHALHEFPAPLKKMAVLSATVDDDIQSDTFGQITALSIDSGGDGYAAQSEFRLTSFTGVQVEIPDSVVLRAVNAKYLVNFRVESCFGTGATGKPFGEGQDYAWGHIVPLVPTTRVQPDPWSLWSVGGAGGTFSMTFAEGVGDDGLPYWYVSSASASGGDGYSSGNTIDHGPRERPAGFSCTFFDVQPVVTVTTGANGVLTGATVVEPGRFWRNKPWDGSPAAIPDTAVVSNGGSGYAIFGRSEPNVSISAPGGEGCVFTPTWQEDEDDCGRPFWRLSSVAVSGGGGYEDGTQLSFAMANQAYAPTAIGDYFEVAPSAVLLASEGIPNAVTVTEPGRGWNSNESVPAIVADTTVVIEQGVGSDGSDAVVTAEVDDQYNSPTFGQVIAFHVTNGGSGYTFLGGPQPGVSGVTLGSFGCLYAGGLTDYSNAYEFGEPHTLTGTGGPLEIWFRGHGEKMFVSGFSWLANVGPVWVATTEVTDCDTQSYEFQSAFGTTGTITVTRGGLFDACERGVLRPTCGECGCNMSTLKAIASITVELAGCVNSDACCQQKTIEADGLHNRPGGSMSHTEAILNRAGSQSNVTVGVSVFCENGVAKSYGWVQTPGCDQQVVGQSVLKYAAASPITHTPAAFPDCLPSTQSGDETIGLVRIQWTVEFQSEW